MHTHTFWRETIVQLNVAYTYYTLGVLLAPSYQFAVFSIVLNKHFLCNKTIIVTSTFSLNYNLALFPTLE